MTQYILVTLEKLPQGISADSIEEGLSHLLEALLPSESVTTQTYNLGALKEDVDNFIENFPKGKFASSEEEEGEGDRKMIYIVSEDNNYWSVYSKQFKPQWEDGTPFEVVKDADDQLATVARLYPFVKTRFLSRAEIKAAHC